MQQDNLDREFIAKNLRLIKNTIGSPGSVFTAGKTVNSLIGADLLMGFGKRKRKRSIRKVRKVKGFGND